MRYFNLSDQTSSEFNLNQLRPYQISSHWLAQAGLGKQRRKHGGRHHWFGRASNYFGYFDHEDESNKTFFTE